MFRPNANGPGDSMAMNETVLGRNIRFPNQRAAYRQYRPTNEKDICVCINDCYYSSAIYSIPSKCQLNMCMQLFRYLFIDAAICNNMRNADRSNVFLTPLSLSVYDVLSFILTNVTSTQTLNDI